ncbi:NAD-dependent epimerase/dehydratase family protein (macronuclear) [Tetrahymena thermophila SB210]|uniref:NAD-dependent epimerase/dehydratase family protein n=1 Tax=Tetrahymena thermophila (strain SB210) TaxID=312017 RepID=A4VEE1_TETTS|nr:NAD-dependent epimerase/dehydratase family protein [Tetrahymena thermophila SB210]EDK31897.1 NAD-dependent epimerase/dehydratase family protein [Tetrahymena thermophila SB210]|eukprot:XP_001470740.1 NAD-dependent epimerase/dehydratase family protein [Tetrahymena thermophila SB210]
MSISIGQQRDNSHLRVLVTGASGYLAGHVLYYLLERGYKVRGTVRSLKDPKKINHLYDIYPSQKDNLELVEADLLNKDCWDSAMKEVDYVIHVASPFPNAKPKNEDEIIKPAVEGTTSVYEAALRNNVKKIVITSSIVAVFTGIKEKNNFTESDWSNIPQCPPYDKSKTLAERKAWEIYDKNKDKIQMTIINPGFIQGPSFHSNQFTSADFVVRVMKNDLPGIPKISLQTVDVRDVALAHVVCLDQDKLEITNAKRYLLVEGSYWMADMVQVLKEEFKRFGYKFPSFKVESKLLFSMAGCIDDQVELVKPFFGRMITFDNSASKNDLGIKYIYYRKTLIEFAYDLIKKGVIPNKINAQKL